MTKAVDSSRTTTRGSFYRRHGKRLLDLAIAIPASVVLLPVIAVTALAVLYNFGRPVLFSQPRPGLDEKPFTLYKFRSMSNARDPDGNLLLFAGTAT